MKPSKHHLGLRSIALIFNRILLAKLHSPCLGSARPQSLFTYSGMTKPLIAFGALCLIYQLIYRLLNWITLHRDIGKPQTLSQAVNRCSIIHCTTRHGSASSVHKLNLQNKVFVTKIAQSSNMLSNRGDKVILSVNLLEKSVNKPR